MISLDDFAKVELKVGTVLEAEEIPNLDKLLKLQVDLGEEKPRQVLSGIRKWYKSEKLIGKQFVFITNLESKVIMGLKSEGMILAVGDKKPILLKPASKVSPGLKVR